MILSDLFPSLQPRERIFSILLCGLFALTGLNIGFYPVFYATGTVALVCVCHIWKDTPTSQRWMLFLPFPFILYVALSPGAPFKDLPIADKMLTSYLIGIAASCLPRPILFRAILFLPLTIAILFLFGLLTSFQYDMEMGDRLALWFSHPNILGFISVWCILFLLVFPPPTQTPPAPFRIQQLTRPILILIMLAAVVLSMSRASLLGGLGACIPVVILKFSSLSRQHLSHWCAIGVTVCLGLGLFGYALLPQAQWLRLQSAVISPTQDATFQSRLALWHVAREGISENPLTGNALRTFPTHFTTYLQLHGDTLKQQFSIIDEKANHPHNLYMGLTFAYGAIGIVLLVFGFLPAVRNAWKQQYLFFLAILCLYLIHGFFDYPLHRKDGILLLFFPLGLVYGTLYLRRINVSGQPPADQKKCDAAHTSQPLKTSSDTL